MSPMNGIFGELRGGSRGSSLGVRKYLMQKNVTMRAPAIRIPPAMLSSRRLEEAILLSKHNAGKAYMLKCQAHVARIRDGHLKSYNKGYRPDIMTCVTALALMEELIWKYESLTLGTNCIMAGSMNIACLVGSASAFRLGFKRTYLTLPSTLGTYMFRSWFLIWLFSSLCHHLIQSLTHESWVLSRKLAEWARK